MYDEIVETMNGSEEILNKHYCSQITKLPERNLEDVFLIILHYYNLNENFNKEELINGTKFPYLGKLISKSGKGLNFKAQNIPEKLQKILTTYLKLIS